MRTTPSSILAVSTLLLLAAQPSAAQGRDSAPAVENAVQLASDFLIEKVGSDIFTRDFRQMGWRDGPVIKGKVRTTEVRFRFSPPASPWVDISLEITVHDSGDLTVQRDWIVPNCAEEPARCMVQVHAEQAVEIAEGYGWQHGEDEWRVELRTMTRFLGFVCVVSKRTGPSSRDVLVIDSYTGEVLEEHNEMSVP